MIELLYSKSLDIGQHPTRSSPFSRLGLRVLPNDLAPAVSPAAGAFLVPTFRLHSNHVRDTRRGETPRGIAKFAKDKIMTAAQIKFLAQMIINGHAVLVERNGKIVPVSKL